MHWEVNGMGQGHNVNPTNKLMSISYRMSNGNRSAESCAHKQEGTVNSKMRRTTLYKHTKTMLPGDDRNVIGKKLTAIIGQKSRVIET